jgi:threonine synthase
LGPRFRCSGCGTEQPAVADAATALPFRCVAARPGDDIDHIVVSEARPTATDAVDPSAEPPLLRWRRRLSAHALAVDGGLGDSGFRALYDELADALGRIEGQPPTATRLITIRPTTFRMKSTIHGKVEADFVAGSHKARHLLPVLLWLRVAESIGLLDRAARRPLAIASCGNAALAAATLAAAAAWPIRVFVPPNAADAVVARLQALGATIVRCPRRPGEAGDPCVLRAREATGAGAIPFCVQGSECGMTIEGAEILAFETAEQLADLGCHPTAAAPLDVAVQIGGGALASGFSAGLRAAGVPHRLFPVQMEGCAPLARAYEASLAVPTEALDETGRALAAPRSRAMWPWQPTPASAATGILDDETYDWRAVVAATRHSGGRPLVTPESALEPARALAEAATDTALAFTGVAGLAGVLATPQAFGPNVLVLLSGQRRGADPG